MKKTFFLIVSFFLCAQQLIVLGMSARPSSGLKYNETIFSAQYEDPYGGSFEFGTGKEYGDDGWQTPQKDRNGDAKIPVFEKSEMAGIEGILDGFKPSNVEEFKKKLLGYSLNTSWYITNVGRSNYFFSYPLQLLLSRIKNQYLSRIFEILIEMGAPIQNIKGYCPFRHLLNLIMKTNSSDMREQYKKCIEILIKKKFNFDVPLAKSNGHYIEDDPDGKDLIDVDSQATGRACIAKAIEYCQNNNLYQALTLLEEIKTKIDAIPVASLVEKPTVPVIEKKEPEDEKLSLSPTESPAIVVSATSPAITAGMSSLFPYSVVPPKKDAETTIQPPTGSGLPSSASTPSISSPNHFDDQIQPKSSSTPTGQPIVTSAPAPSVANPGSPTASASSSNNRLWQWCNMMQSTTLRKSLCVLAVGSAAMLAATKLWWRSPSNADNDSPLSITFENKTGTDLMIHTDQPVENLLPSNQSQTLDVSAISKLTIASSSNDTSTDIITIPLWLYKRYRASATLHITITPEKWAFKRWWFGTSYTYSARWE